jgi:hypothetical protein
LIDGAPTSNERSRSTQLLRLSVDSATTFRLIRTCSNSYSARALALSRTGGGSGVLPSAWDSAHDQASGEQVEQSAGRQTLHDQSAYHSLDVRPSVTMCTPPRCQTGARRYPADSRRTLRPKGERKKCGSEGGMAAHHTRDKLPLMSPCGELRRPEQPGSTPLAHNRVVGVYRR